MRSTKWFLAPIMALSLATTVFAAADPNVNDIVVTKGAGAFKGTVLMTFNNPDIKGFQARIVEVDSTGKVVWENRFPFGGGLADPTKLESGNVMYVEMGKGIREIDKTGKIVWRYDKPVTHHAEPLANGNILAVSAYENWAREINFDGETVWEWKASEQIRDFTDENYHKRSSAQDFERLRNSYAVFRERGWSNNPSDADWTHINMANRMPNGNTLLGLRNLDLVVEVDRNLNVVWTFGALVLKHQHSPQILPNGNILMVDNGNARVIEVEKATHRIVWQYRSTDMKMPAMGHAQRLDDGRTLITDSYNSRVILVDKAGEIVWELKVNTPLKNGIYRAKYTEL